jgi:hypothetical protein
MRGLRGAAAGTYARSMPADYSPVIRKAETSIVQDS